MENRNDSPFPKPMRSTSELQARLNQLLDVWNIITNQNVRLIPSVERALFEFQKLYTKADLEDTLNFIVYRNRHADRPWHLRFEKFFDSEFVHFESLRAEAETAAKAKAAKGRAWKATTSQAAWAEAHGEEVAQPATEPRMSKDLILTNLDKLKSDISRQ